MAGLKAVGPETVASLCVVMLVKLVFAVVNFFAVAVSLHLNPPPPPPPPPPSPNCIFILFFYKYDSKK